MFYAGIDIAKYNHEASVIDADGKALLDSISFTNTQSGCEKLLALFERLRISKDCIIIGMEATGHYWLSAYSFLIELGYDVKVINPIQSEAFRKMYIRQTKNDSKDSFIIAKIMRFGQYSATSLSEESTIALRQLSRYRMALVDNCGDCKRRVIALLDQVFPEYDGLFSDTFGVASKEVLLKYPTPEDMLNEVIISEIGDIHRFDAPGKLVAFAGLDVRVNQSGEFAGTKNKISTGSCATSSLSF